MKYLRLVIATCVKPTYKIQSISVLQLNVFINDNRK